MYNKSNLYYNTFKGKSGKKGVWHSGGFTPQNVRRNYRGSGCTTLALSFVMLVLALAIYFGVLILSQCDVPALASNLSGLCDWVIK